MLDVSTESLPAAVSPMAPLLRVHQLEQTISHNRILATVAHELRSPLSTIRGLSEFLSEGAGGSLTPTQEQLISAIHDTSKTTLEMVDELLDWAATTQAPRLVLTQQNLGELLERCISTMNLEAARKKTHITFQSPRFSVRPPLDGPKMTQVISNLLSNAIKFSPPAATITVVLDSDPRLGRCSFRVQDQGPGIPPAERPHLFVEFNRLSAKPTGGEKSTGLGLAICRKIVDGHRGSILVENLGRGGCEFRVVLPLTWTDPPNGGPVTGTNCDRLLHRTPPPAAAA